jgi:hypothetical protein
LQKDKEDLTYELEKEKQKNRFLESEIESLEEEKIDFEESMKNSEKFENTNKILIKENKSLKDELQKLKKKES